MAQYTLHCPLHQLLSNHQFSKQHVCVQNILVLAYVCFLVLYVSNRGDFAPNLYLLMSWYRRLCIKLVLTDAYFASNLYLLMILCLGIPNIYKCKPDAKISNEYKSETQAYAFTWNILYILSYCKLFSFSLNLFIFFFFIYILLISILIKIVLL